MNSILNVTSDIKFDDSLAQFQYHSHQPYAGNTFNTSDEIRIPIHQQDVYTFPSLRYVYLEGRISKKNGTDGTTSKFTNNAFVFLFDEIRYELNGIEVDRVRNPGITTTLKCHTSFSPNQVKGLENAGWIILAVDKTVSIDKNVFFSVCLPLDTLLGICEDYRQILINLKQELVLIRSSTDLTCVKGSDDVQIKLDKVVWRMPHVRVSDQERLKLLKIVDKNKVISIPFRSWDLYEYPNLPASQQENWTVKSSTNLEKPRYVIAFQTDRTRNATKDSSQFDSCKLKNLKLYLNSEQYPYDDLNLDFAQGKVALLYEMYNEFQTSYYYGNRHSQPLLSRSDFETFAPIVVIDCSKQSEAIKSTTNHIRVLLEASENFPPNTTAYCLILHDKIVEYEVGTGMVRKMY